MHLSKARVSNILTRCGMESARRVLFQCILPRASGTSASTGAVFSDRLQERTRSERIQQNQAEVYMDRRKRWMTRIPSSIGLFTCGRHAVFGTMILGAMLVTCAASLHAQSATATLNVSPRPNPYLSEWASRKETAIMTVTVPAGNPGFQARFYVEIKKDGALQARTKFERMPVITVPSGVSTWFAENMIPFSAVEFSGGAEKTAAKTGMLPSGDYEFCVDLRDPQTGRSFIGDAICRNFMLTGYDAPVLLMPEDHGALRANERPTFRWSPVTPQPPGLVEYRVMVFEVLEGQRAMQAFRANRPILDRSVKAATQLIWPPEFALPGRVKDYVWTVRALDDRGNPLGAADGYAQPFTFAVGGGEAQRTTAGTGEKPAATLDQGQARKIAQDQGQGQAQKIAQDQGQGQAQKIAQDQVQGQKQAQQQTLKSGKTLGGIKDYFLPPNQQTPDTTNFAGGNPQAPPTACQPSQTQPPVIVDQTPTNLTGNDYTDSLVTVGFFTMKILTATGTGASLSGTGSILVNWLRTPVAVEFTNIKINAAKQVFNGSVVSQTAATPDPYQTQWAANIAGSLPWTKARIKNLDTWLKANFGKLVKDLDLPTQVANATDTPVKLPLGVNNLKGYTIAIAELRFTAAGAEAAAVMSLPVLEHGDDLGFKASSIACTPSGPSFHSGTFGLLNDVTFAPNNDTWSVTFKAPTDTANGCFLDWDCDGFRRAQVDMDFALPRTWLTPSPDNNQKVKLNVKTWITDWDDWIVNANLPKSTIAGTNGTDLEVINMGYDHSDVRNPAGIKFPKGYQGDTTAAFQGFFIKQTKLLLPEKLTSYDDPTKRITLWINNLILNKNGVTCDIQAANILQFPKANVASLGASIDSIKIAILNSSVQTAYLRGLITLPIADSTATNALDYKALFQNGDGFQFTLSPKGPIYSPFFAGGKFTLAQSSVLKVTLKDKASFDLKLTGGFAWEDKQVGPIKHVDFSTSFQNMRASWVEGGGWSFDIGTWSFASPQKSIAKFPVSIDNVKYVPKTKQGDEVFRGGVAFELIVNLTEKFAGRTKLEVVGAVEKPAGKKFKPTFISAQVDSVGLFIKTSAVTIDGFAVFYQDHPIYGNGFAGSVKASFTTAQIEIQASARFGSTSYQSGSPYRYWYVDGKAILPPPGVAFLPGYAFYGLGVAAWQRMNVTTIPNVNVASVANATTTTTTTSSGASFTPNAGIGFGFGLTAVLGTTPDPKKFNADVTLGGQFSPSGGLIDINITGELWAMAKLLERASAPVHGTIAMNYNHPSRIFHMQAKVDINKAPITTPGGVNMVMHLEGLTGNWYVKIGEPANRNIIKVYNINTESYFMFGKSITAPTGFSQTIANGLSAAGVGVAGPNADATNNAIAGNGFAAGVGVTFDTGNRYRNIIGRVNLAYHIAAGFEVNLSLLRYPDNAFCAGGGSLNGVNKWYTQGMVAAYAIFYFGIHIDMKDGTLRDPCAYCCKNNHPNGCDFDIVDFKMGAYLAGGFPNPTWLQGQGHGSYNLLNGAVSGSFTVNIDYGTPCTPSAPADNGPVAQAQDAAADQRTLLIKSLYPKHNTANVALTDRPRVLYGFTPNQSFDIIESQGGTAGATVNRTFQARYTVFVDKNVNNVHTNLPIQTAANPLGEYIVFQPSNVVNMQQYNLNMSNDGGGNSPPPTYGKNLDSSSVYRVTVTGTLWELKNSVWAPAKTRANQPVVQAVVSQFSTVFPPPQPKKMDQNLNKNMN
jgi:hypothetical protein